MALSLVFLFADSEKPSAFRKHGQDENARRKARAARIQTPLPSAGKVTVEPGGGESGMAFILAAAMDGRPTASGEPFDSTAMTASHPRFPLRSMVRVTNLDSGKAIVVRINDRGGFSGDRILGLTRRAAEELGFGRAGFKRVRVEAVNGTGK